MSQTQQTEKIRQRTLFTEVATRCLALANRLAQSWNEDMEGQSIIAAAFLRGDIAELDDALYRLASLIQINQKRGQ